MDKIHVVDNFLEKDDLEKAMHAIKNVKWSFGHKSNRAQSSETPFWSCSLNDDPLFTDLLLTVIQKTFHRRFKINRVYVNGQSFGQDGSYHIDDAEEDCYSFVLYLHDIFESDVELAGGHIYFKLPDVKYKICYEPILNRGILFPSNYIHRACSFSRYIMELRTCAAWKLKEITDVV
jgi:hypothetical protein